MITVQPADPESAAAQTLMAELSAVLTRLTGSSGAATVAVAELRQPRARFAVARDAAGRAVGCGALRPLSHDTAEVKRMYAQPGTRGVGAALLAWLEAEALALGYAQIWLETRLVNTRAVEFYLRHGYQIIPNYGVYAGNAAAVCFEKQLAVER